MIRKIEGAGTPDLLQRKVIYQDNIDCKRNVEKVNGRVTAEV